MTADARVKRAIGVTSALVLAGCASLSEMRTGTPDHRTLTGVAPEMQENVARCIQDRAYDEIGIMFAIVQETRREPDGWHVIGRAAQMPAHITWDVAVRAEAVEVRFSSAPILPRGRVRSAVRQCTGQDFVEE